MMDEPRKPTFSDRTSEVLEEQLGLVECQVRWNSLRQGIDLKFNKKWERISDDLDCLLRDRIGLKCDYQRGKMDPKAMKWPQRDWDEALTAVAKKEEVNPAQAYFLSFMDEAKEISVEAAEETLCHVMHEALGVPMDSKLNRWTATAIWCGVIERVMNPGVAQRVIPVIVGDQDCGKSSFIAHMLPEELKDYFQPNLNLFQQDHTEFVYQMMGMILAEAPELAGSAKAEARAFKARIGTGEDQVRLKYGRHVTRFKRTVFIVGTANNEQSLPRDHTGNTRFAVLECPEGGTGWQDGRALPPHKIVAIHREECWRAAMRLMLQDETKYRPSFIPGALREEQKRINEHHAPMNDVAVSAIGKLMETGWMGAKDVKEIAVEAKMIDEARSMTNMEISDVKQALVHFGCKEVRRKVGGRSIRLWTDGKTIKQAPELAA